MTAPRLTIVNDGLSANKGDQAILRAMLEALHAAFPDAAIRCFPNSDMRRPGLYLAYWRALAETDLLIFGGGQEIQDHASLAFLVSGLLKIALARLRGRAVLGYALGVGPVATRPGRRLTRLILNRVNALTVRDEFSRECLQALGVQRPPCEVTADPALTLTPAPDAKVEQMIRGEGIPSAGGCRVVIAPRRWFHYGHYYLPMGLRARLFPLRGQDRYREVERAVAEAADHLVDRRGAQVVFLPMRRAAGRSDPGQDDDRVSEEIRNLMRRRDCAYLVRGDHAPETLKAFLGRANLVVGMRMHALILASMMGVPVVSIQLSRKAGSLLDRLGQAALSVPVEDLRAGTLIPLLDRALDEAGHLRAALLAARPALQDRARATVEAVRRLLAEAASAHPR
jgi:polysaccharide pyruvyl transferase WcaK-like protein